MKNETLLDRSISNYKTAIKLYKILSDDEFELNLIGYLLQQSIELFLKHHAEINGVKYSRTHDIAELLGVVRDNEIPIQIEETFEFFADVFTVWESKTRYVKNYFLEKRSVEKGFSLVFNLLKNNGVDVECINAKIVEFGD